jgi:hypothetical protein
MAEDRKCAATRTHKPHLWSRTTKKTVTEETAGDTFQCPGSAHVGLREVKKGEISADRLAEIRLSVAESRGRSMFADPTPDMDRFHGAMCRCGVHRKPKGLAVHSADDGMCTVHPERQPQPYVRGASE